MRKRWIVVERCLIWYNQYIRKYIIKLQEEQLCRRFKTNKIEFYKSRLSLVYFLEYWLRARWTQFLPSSALIGLLMLALFNSANINRPMRALNGKNGVQRARNQYSVTSTSCSVTWHVFVKSACQKKRSTVYSSILHTLMNSFLQL